jgi:phosphoadenosine phosphosulfate reductase
MEWLEGEDLGGMSVLFLEEKVAEAIEFLRRNEPRDGYYVVKFSGGKDSIVLYDIVKRAGVRHKVYYNFTTIDPPELARFIRRYYSEVEWIIPQRNFFSWLKRVGPPTKAKRWCCVKLKHIIPKGARHVVLGIRAEESWKRARRGRVVYNKETRTIDYYPIFYFTEADVWEYIEREGLKYPSLYDEGFDRLGCVVCPYVCRSGLLERHRERWGMFYDAFERCCREYFEGRREWYEAMGVRSFEEFLEAWYRGERGVKVLEAGKAQLARLW